MKNILKSKDNVEVLVIDGISHSHRPDLDKEVISKINIADRPFIRETIDMGRVIGVDHLVETNDDDVIVFLDRHDKGYQSRMVLNRKPNDTRYMTIVIAKGGPEDGDLDGKYILITVFEGHQGKPEPVGDNADDPECINFWNYHALVPTEEEFLKIKQE